MKNRLVPLGLVILSLGACQQGRESEQLLLAMNCAAIYQLVAERPRRPDDVIAHDYQLRVAHTHYGAFGVLARNHGWSSEEADRRFDAAKADPRNIARVAHQVPSVNRECTAGIWPIPDDPAS